MKFTRQRFCLFFPMPLQAGDWANLEASHVRDVMLVMGTSTRIDDLKRLQAMGKHVVIRVPTNMVTMADGAAHIKKGVQDTQANVVVDAVILGNEVDEPFDLSFGSRDWGQQTAYRWLVYFTNARIAVQALGVPVVSPGLTMRSISEDEMPMPGRATWTEITRLEYDQCDLNGAHVYGYWWRSDVDRQRFKWALKMAAEASHKMLMIDEVGVPNADSDLERMNAYIEMAGLLERLPIGERVALFCPFVSNGDPGNPPQWDGRYIMRDIEAYKRLGAFITEKKQGA